MKLFVSKIDTFELSLNKFRAFSQSNAFVIPLEAQQSGGSTDMIVLRCIDEDEIRCSIVIPDFFNYVFIDLSDASDGAMATAINECVTVLNHLLARDNGVLLSACERVDAYPVMGYTNNKSYFLRTVLYRDQERKALDDHVTTFRKSMNDGKATSKLGNDYKMIISRLRETQIDIRDRFVIETKIKYSTWISTAHDLSAFTSKPDMRIVNNTENEYHIPFSMLRSLITDYDVQMPPPRMNVCSFYVVPTKCLFDHKGDETPRVPYAYQSESFRSQRDLKQSEVISKYGCESPISSIIITTNDRNGNTFYVSMSHSTACDISRFVFSPIENSDNVNENNVREELLEMENVISYEDGFIAKFEYGSEYKLIVMFFAFISRYADVLSGWKILHENTLESSIDYMYGRLQVMKMSVPHFALGLNTNMEKNASRPRNMTVTANYPNTTLSYLNPFIGVSMIDLFYYQRKFHKKMVLSDVWEYYERSADRDMEMVLPNELERSIAAMGNVREVDCTQVGQVFCDVIIDILKFSQSVLRQTLVFSRFWMMDIESVWSRGNSHSVCMVVSNRLVSDAVGIGGDITRSIKLGYLDRDYVISKSPELAKYTRDRNERGFGNEFEGGKVEDVKGSRYYQEIVSTLDYSALYASIYRYAGIDHTNIVPATQNNVPHIMGAVRNGDMVLYKLGGASHETVAYYTSQYMKKKERRMLLPDILAEYVALRHAIKKKASACLDPKDIVAYGFEELAVKEWTQTVYGTGATSWTMFDNPMLPHTVAYIGRILYTSMKEITNNCIYIAPSSEGTDNDYTVVLCHSQDMPAGVIRPHVERGDTDGIDIVFNPSMCSVGDRIPSIPEYERISKRHVLLSTRIAEIISDIVGYNTIENLQNFCDDPLHFRLCLEVPHMPSPIIKLTIERICDSVIFHTSKTRSMKLNYFYHEDSMDDLYKFKGGEWAGKSTPRCISALLKDTISTLLDSNWSRSMVWNRESDMKNMCTILHRLSMRLVSATHEIKRDGYLKLNDLGDKVDEYIITRKYKKIASGDDTNNKEQHMTCVERVHKTCFDRVLYFPGEHVRYIMINTAPQRPITMKSYKGWLEAVGIQNLSLNEFKRYHHGDDLMLDSQYYLEQARKLINVLLDGTIAFKYAAYVSLYKRELDNGQVFCFNPCL